MTTLVIAGLVFAGIAVGYEIRRRQTKRLMAAAELRGRLAGRRERAERTEAILAGFEAIHAVESPIYQRWATADTEEFTQAGVVA